MQPTPEQLKDWAESKCLTALSPYLLSDSTNVLLDVLDAIDKMLQAGEAEREKNGGTNPVLELFEHEDAEPLKRIEALQRHVDERVYLKARDILEHYFVSEEDEIGPEDD